MIDDKEFLASIKRIAERQRTLPEGVRELSGVRKLSVVVK